MVDERRGPVVRAVEQHVVVHGHPGGPQHIQRRQVQVLEHVTRLADVEAAGGRAGGEHLVRSEVGSRVSGDGADEADVRGVEAGGERLGRER